MPQKKEQSPEKLEGAALSRKRWGPRPHRFYHLWVFLWIFSSS